MDMQAVLFAIGTGKRVHATVIDADGIEQGEVNVPTPACIRDARERGLTLTGFRIGSDSITIGRA